ncbi:hypothetical protein M758_4G246100 [Ceratodon purpureus]|nr:hypothetical protein M758_4G246100 [Ceratodon purpureus]
MPESQAGMKAGTDPQDAARAQPPQLPPPASPSSSPGYAKSVAAWNPPHLSFPPLLFPFLTLHIIPKQRCYIPPLMPVVLLLLFSLHCGSGVHAVSGRPVC